MGLTVEDPLHTVKVRLQTQSVYQGLFHCVFNIHARRGKCCSRCENSSRRHYAKTINAWLSYIVSASWFFQRHDISTAFHWPHQLCCLYSTALDLLTGSRHSDTSQRKLASAAQVFAAGSFSIPFWLCTIINGVL